MDTLLQESAKKIVTRDAAGKENGWLVELFKDKETGRKTEVYLTTTVPGTFKGYHLHRLRTGRFIVIRGKVKFILYTHTSEKWIREEVVLDAEHPGRLSIPANAAAGLETLGDEEAWVINYPNPPYDPALTDEQVEYTQEELEAGVVK